MASSSSAGSASCTTARTDSPISGMRDADDGDVVHRGVPDQHVLDLARVDVHAARDDHVRHAVGEEQVALVVDVADVAERASSPRSSQASAVFSLSPWYSKRCDDSNQIWPASPSGSSLPSSSTTCDGAEQRLADRTRVREPVLGADVAEAAALAARVVLVQDRAEPLDRAALHVGRARRGGVHDHLQARQVVAAPAPRRSSFSMRTRWVGTNCTCVTR